MSQQTEEQGTTGQQPAETGGDTEDKPAADGGESRAEARIRSLSEKNQALSTNVEDMRLTVARLEGRISAQQEPAKSRPEPTPEFEDETEELRFYLRQQQKQLTELKNQTTKDREERAFARALSGAQKGLDFGVFGEEASAFIAAELRSRGPEAARVKAQRLAAKYAPFINQKKTTPQDVAKQVEAKKADAQATRAPKPATTAAPMADKDKPKSWKEMAKSANARYAANWERDQVASSG